MAHDRIDAAQFTKDVSEATRGVSFNLFKEAWTGWGDKPKEGQQQQKGDSTNPFLAPLAKGIGKVGELYFKQMEMEINDALKKSIY